MSQSLLWSVYAIPVVPCTLPLSASCIWLAAVPGVDAPPHVCLLFTPPNEQQARVSPHRSLSSSERLRSLFMHDSFICYIYSFTLSKHPVAGILLSVERTEYGPDVTAILFRYPAVARFVMFSKSPYRHSTANLMGPGDSFLVSKAAGT